MKINTLLKHRVVQVLAIFGLVALPFAATIATPTLVDAQQNKKPDKTCGGVPTAVFSCPDEYSGDGGVETSGVIGILNVVINIMTVAVGIVAIGAFVYAGILYAAAADSEEQVKKAKDIIRNTVIGIILYVGMFMLARYLIPGSGGLL